MADNKKVSEAKRQAIARYEAKTYKMYALRLRIDDDSDIIEAIEESKAHGEPMRIWLRRLFEG